MNGHWLEKLDQMLHPKPQEKSSVGVSNMSSGIISVTVDSETVIVRNSQTGENHHEHQQFRP